MVFTRQDIITFALGAVAAVGITLGEMLVQLDGEPVTDWNEWGLKLGSGLGVSLGRYLVTRVPELLSRAD